jgi:phage terminase small subunit
MTDEELKPLTPRQLAMIDAYFRCQFNATKAYLEIHPKAKYNGAVASASAFLTNPSVKAEIRRRLDESHMSADEALKLLAEQARGDIGEILSIGGVDLTAAKEKGLTHLIKRIKQKTTIIQGKGNSGEDKEITDIEVELYDAQSAIDKILRVHGKYKDGNDLPPGTEIIIRVGVDPNKV